MCEEIPKIKLPLLPGYEFSDPTKNKFHVSHSLDFHQGIPNAKIYVPGSGNSSRDIDSMHFAECEEQSIRLDPKLTYGRLEKPAVRPFRPHYVLYDRNCLKFEGYFQQAAYNSPNETWRIRPVDVLYFLEDDTVTVIEPKIPNCGLPQGRLVRRSRIPQSPPPDCEYLHWKDLNLGKDVRICGFVIRLTSCDAHTREFLTSQGIDVEPAESIPCDEFNRRRLLESNGPGISSSEHPELKFRRFLEYDGIVLRFRACEVGSTQDAFCISYFLADKTIQVSEILEKNNGKDPFPVLLKRTKLPKNWEKVELTFPSIAEEVAKHVTEFYEPRDLIIGHTISVYGREMLIHMCDNYTRNYYTRCLKITQPDNFSVNPPKALPKPRELPPYTGYGELEDSLQSCLHFTLKPPKQDIVRKIVHANHYLRYKAKLVSTHPEDEGRVFIISYSLADGTLEINEPPRRNSGHPGGRFLSSMKVAKPGSAVDFPEYYTPHDFYIGSILTINDFRFIITGVDLHVFNYMQENREKFRTEVIDSITQYVHEEGLLNPRNC